VEQSEKIRRLINYFSLFDSPLDLRDAKLLINDFNIKNISDLGIILKDNLLALSEKYLLERMKYEAYNKNLIKLSNFILKYLLRYSNAKLICITGSLAYWNARPWDDIDLLVVANRRDLMKTLIKIFILNRKLKLAKLKINLCINFAISIENFNTIVDKNCSRLAAFDLIKAIPSDVEFFNSLISNTNCVKKYFNSYSNIKNKSNFINQSNSTYSFASIFFFILLFIYFRIITKIRNLKLLKKKLFINLFTYDLSLNYFIIKSYKYEILKNIFERIF